MKISFFQRKLNRFSKFFFPRLGTCLKFEKKVFFFETHFPGWWPGPKAASEISVPKKPKMSKSFFRYTFSKKRKTFFVPDWWGRRICSDAIDYIFYFCPCYSYIFSQSYVMTEISTIIAVFFPLLFKGNEKEKNEQILSLI